ncbi:MAG: hypothetical protein IJC36_04695 [Clostridia bacterium]|nr:hypothetical protein [Clostridia bacterium]
MIPIEKNIIVVDEQGNEYEATYPKRAKGLVKNGRARFIDENIICLACPPDTKLEDKNMSENKKVIDKTTAENAIEEPQKLTINYVLEQIEKIQNQTDHIGMALAALGNMVPKTNSTTPDVAGAEQAEAIAEVIESREATNQKLIALYEKMYDDLKPREESIKIKALEMLSGIVREAGFYESEQAAEMISNMLETIRHLG